MDSQQNLYFAIYQNQLYSFNTTNGLRKFSIFNFKSWIQSKKLGNLTTILTSTEGKVDGNGLQASFDGSQGIYFDSSSKNLIIGDIRYFSIRKMNQSGLWIFFPFLSFPTTKNKIKKRICFNNCWKWKSRNQWWTRNIG